MFELKHSQLAFLGLPEYGGQLSVEQEPSALVCLLLSTLGALAWGGNQAPCTGGRPKDTLSKGSQQQKASTV